MKLIKYFFPILIVLFLYSCKSQEEVTKNIDSEFNELVDKVKFFAHKNNYKSGKTRDLEDIKIYFKFAHDLVDFAIENQAEYQTNIKELRKKGVFFKKNKYLNFNKVSYQYSHRHLKNLLKMVEKKMAMNPKYMFSFKLRPGDIFKMRPKGHKPGGSKKFDSIMKKFN